MRYAILSDIHSNIKAFRTAVDDAKKNGANRFMLLGDVIGYGYDPRSCIDLSRELSDVILLGNHEAGVAGILSLSWFSETAARGVLEHRGKITSDDRKWINGLNYKYIEYSEPKKFMCVHGTPAAPIDDFGYVISHWDAVVAAEAAYDCDILFCGHVHEARKWMVPGREDHDYIKLSEGVVTNEVLEPSIFKIEDGKRYIFNVGSVGYPRVQSFTCYCIYDTDKSEVEYRILPFDFDDYEKSMKSADIQVPRWLNDAKSGVSKDQKYSV